MSATYAFVYDPVGFDRWDPRVIAGVPIRYGARVRKIGQVGGKRGRPPSARVVFYWIEDEQGNRQSVARSSVKSRAAYERGNHG